MCWSLAEPAAIFAEFAKVSWVIPSSTALEVTLLEGKVLKRQSLFPSIWKTECKGQKRVVELGQSLIVGPDVVNILLLVRWSKAEEKEVGGEAPTDSSLASTRLRLVHRFAGSVNPPLPWAPR